MRMTPLLTSVPPYYDKLKENFEFTIYKIFNRFMYNNFKANTTKCHFFLSPYQSATIIIDGSIIKNSNSQKVLGVKIDSDFTFEKHINSLCRNQNKNQRNQIEIKNYMHCPTIFITK